MLRNSLAIDSGKGSTHEMPKRALQILCVAAVTLLSSLTSEVRSQVPLLPSEVERIDVIAIERDGRDLYAFDALTGRRSMIRLDIAEEVLFERSRGRVGIVLTSRRALGVAPGTDWIEARVGLQEVPAESGLVEDRVAIVVTDRRALAFTGASGWIGEKFQATENPVAIRAGSGAGAVVTNRRALGVAPGLSRFVAQDLQIREVLESVGTQDTLISLRTDRRILVFSAPRASWTEQKRQIN